MITRFKSSIRQMLRKRGVRWLMYVSALLMAYVLSAGQAVGLAFHSRVESSSISRPLQHAVLLAYLPVYVVVGSEFCPPALQRFISFSAGPQRFGIGLEVYGIAQDWEGNVAGGNSSITSCLASSVKKFARQIMLAYRPDSRESERRFVCGTFIRSSSDENPHPDSWSDVLKKSLSKRISLHEDQVPLGELIKKIQKVGDINIHLDPDGLEAEDVTIDTPVTIDVDGIQVKSALNLILSRYNLAYLIDNEVLKITSRARQQSELASQQREIAGSITTSPSNH